MPLKPHLTHSKDTSNQCVAVTQKGTLDNKNLSSTVTLTTKSLVSTKGGWEEVVPSWYDWLDCSRRRLPPVTLSPEMSAYLPPPRYLAYALSSLVMSAFQTRQTFGTFSLTHFQKRYKSFSCLSFSYPVGLKLHNKRMLQTLGLLVPTPGMKGCCVYVPLSTSAGHSVTQTTNPNATWNPGDWHFSP